MSDPFWKLFEEHAHVPDGDTVGFVDLLYEELVNIDPNLVIEISEPDDTGSREFILSANGQVELFETVEKLIASAPPTPLWQFLALRPARGFDFVLSFDGKEISPATWKFRPVATITGDEGVEILIPPHKRKISDDVLALVIEVGVGERAFAELGHLSYTQSMKDDDFGDWFPIAQLPGYLNEPEAS